MDKEINLKNWRLDWEDTDDYKASFNLEGHEETVDFPVDTNLQEVKSCGDNYDENTTKKFLSITRKGQKTNSILINMIKNLNN